MFVNLILIQQEKSNITIISIKKKEKKPPDSLRIYIKTL